MNKLDIWRTICRNRYFELGVADAIRQKHIYSPTYLSLGQEHVPAIVSKLCPNWKVFPQHRCHSWYLSYTNDEEGLAKELLGRADGCNRGYGGSPSVSSPDKIFGHSGLLGDQIPIAVGAAHASGKPTICVLGDAAAEEDYALGAFGYAATKKAPVLFVCEDNDLSILTKKSVRRSWDAVSVVKAMGIRSMDIQDQPQLIWNCVERLSERSNLPAFINIRVCRHYWHAGAGIDSEPERHTFNIFRESLNRSFGDIVITIESEERERMNALWSRLVN